MLLDGWVSDEKGQLQLQYNLHSVALQCCPGALNSVTVKHKNRTVKKQYYSDNETVQQLGSRECSFEQDGLKWLFKFTDVGNVM